jgi:hypothetical protein
MLPLTEDRKMNEFLDSYEVNPIEALLERLESCSESSDDDQDRDCAAAAKEIRRLRALHRERTKLTDTALAENRELRACVSAAIEFMRTGSYEKGLAELLRKLSAST